MASPNVAGIVAQLLQIYPGETPAQIRQRVIDLSTFNVLYSTGSTTDYAVTNSLHGAPNRYAFYEYSPATTSSFIATGAIEMNNTTITT
jgi:subtilisin family serine protease